jgi:hypothetical protein
MKVQEADCDPKASARPGVKRTINWRLPKPPHDVYLTAVATGPGVTELYWPVAKPYQRMSSRWEPYVLGCTGAVWVDADGSGTVESAIDYARRVIAEAKGDTAVVIKGLSGYDAAVAAEAASLLRAAGVVTSPDVLEALARSTAAEAVRVGFAGYAAAWRESDAARVLRDAAP